MNFGHILFGFRGRINRAKWWLAVLISIVISLVVTGLVIAINSDAATTVLNIISYILTLWISLAAGAKRLHDLNKSGAWLLLFFGGPILLLILFVIFAVASVGTAALTSGGAGLSPEALTAMIMQLGGIGLIFVVLWLALAIWALVWLGCLRGTVGPNQYGPDPLEGRI